VQAAEYEERAPLMFKLDAEGPTASGRPAVTRTVTKENVQSAWWAANGYCEEHGAALSEAYGNFDRVVALGWLLGDVAIGCLIEKADAFKVGRKAGKLAPGLKAEFDAPARRLGKRKHTSDDDWAAAANEAAGIRSMEVDLPLPMRPPRARPAAYTAPAAPAMLPAPTPAPTRPVESKRQRVEPEPPAPAPAASGERVELLEPLLAAEKHAHDADCAIAAAKRRRDQAQAAWEYVREQAGNPHRLAQLTTDAQWDAFEKKLKSDMDTARARLLAAERAVGDAEEANYWAKYEVKEARIELKEHDDEHARKADFEREKAESAEKWGQIAQGISAHNACYNTWDREYWEPDAWELTQLHGLWKIQPDSDVGEV
jgi:hypothetical protein